MLDTIALFKLSFFPAYKHTVEDSVIKIIVDKIQTLARPAPFFFMRNIILERAIKFFG